MKLKKFLLILLAAVSCACIVFAFGCIEEENDKDVKYTVDFSLSEHVTYVIDGEEVAEYKLEVDKETQVNFSVLVEDGFLTETLVVKADAETLAATNGVYSYHVTKDVTVSATVSEDLLEGNGTDESPFLVSSLKDLRFVADMVNSGYPDYVTGNYQLQNDIDCGGAQLDVIGHFENSSAFFAGIFDGQDHTISNYTISTNGKTYVGLFGCVQLSTSSNTVIIQRLNLKDFTINATAANDGSVCVGAIVAFGAGANVVACSAEGNVNVYGSGYFSYAGGAVGILQSLTIPAADGLLYHYHSTVEYVHTKVVIGADLGYISAAGGVVGYAISSHERAASVIINSYAEGNIFGAMRSGGVVGTLGDYSSVANCYARGFVSATVAFPADTTDSEYFAYAGGIAAYAGVESTISDSFTTCILNADSINTANATGEIYAYASPETEFVNAVAVFNSYAGKEAKPTNENFIKNTLKWSSVDWTITDGAYPKTNYQKGEESSTLTNSFDITLSYVNNTVKGDASKQVSVEVYDNSYFPFSSHLDEENGDIDEFIVADAKGHTSFGFFFDEDCTNKVPYGFVPTRDITLYVGFADYSKVAGSYEFAEKSGRTVKLILNTNATYIYADAMDFTGTYVYNGYKLIFNDALFARLSGKAVTGNVTLSNGTVKKDVAQYWLNYQPYKFIGTGGVAAGKISVYDGTYFTNDKEDNLLEFNLAGEQLNTNNFIGTWEQSSSINEKYIFNDDMTWSYSWKTKNLNGSYSITGGVASLTGDKTATASIDKSGLLLIEETGKDGKYYGLENSFDGSWYSSESGAYLVLDGYGTGLAGGAAAIVDGTVYDSLAYVKDGFFDVLTSNPYTYTIISGYSLFGYFTYDATARTITAKLYDEAAADFLEFKFILLDYYLGEWIGEEVISEEEADNVPYTIMDFNGLGLYKAEGNALLGYVVINGTKVPYECSVENGLDGTFTYNGTPYTLTTNGDGTVTVSADGTSANLYRKDEMASTPLVDEDDNVYKFNGGGYLKKGGILTVTSEDGEEIDRYVYKIVSGSIDGYLDKNGKVIEGFDILINLYESSVDGEVIGTVKISYPKFVIKVKGKEEVSLDLYFLFAGRPWSIAGINNSFFIGKFDLTYEATGSYNKQQNVPFVYFPEYNYIYIYYSNHIDTAFRMYLLLLDDSNLIVSSYPYLVEGDYRYAALSDEFVGSWENKETGSVLTFNGTADSKYAVGIAWDSTKGITYLYTRRFGKVYMWRADDESVAYTLKIVRDGSLSGDNVYSKENSPLAKVVLTEADVLGQPICESECEGVKYEFNFDGTIKVGDKSGTYLIDSVDGNTTTVIIRLDGEEITAVVDHSDGTLEIAD